MKQDIKDQWLAALNSDEYNQGHGELRTKANEYCCLGVLCDLAVKAGVAKWVANGDAGWWVAIPADANLDEIESVDKGAVTVPKFIREWSGLKVSNPWVTFGDEQLSLAHVNDNKNKTFPEIAEIIQIQL